MTREEYEFLRNKLATTRAAVVQFTAEGDVPTGEGMIFSALILIADCLRDLVDK